jgi:hypothetical protein
LDSMTKHMELDSFRHGQCKWHSAHQATMDRDWPQCVRGDMGTIGRRGKQSEARRYAEKRCVLRNSRMTVIVENTREVGYMSEKIFHALAQGNVPIYHVCALVPKPSIPLSNIPNPAP